MAFHSYFQPQNVSLAVERIYRLHRSMIPAVDSHVYTRIETLRQLLLLLVAAAAAPASATAAALVRLELSPQYVTKTEWLSDKKDLLVLAVLVGLSPWLAFVLPVGRGRRWEN